MSDEEKKKRADYEVGYGKPPKHTQFGQNQSGNVNGRPPGANGAKKSIRKMLNKPNRVKVGEDVKHLTTFELSLERLSEGVRKGDKTAIARVVALAREIDKDDEARAASQPAQHYALEPLTSEEEAIVLEYFHKKMLRDAF